MKRRLPEKVQQSKSFMQSLSQAREMEGVKEMPQGTSTLHLTANKTSSSG